MEPKWYVIHTLSGQEQKVKENIEKRIKTEEMGEYIKEVLIPTEKVSEVKRGKKTTTTRKFYPGYLMVHMTLTDDKHQLLDKPWYFIRETPGIIGFVGGDRPIPLSPSEVESMLGQIKEREDKVRPKEVFAVGETVKINDGPFQSLSGTIEEVDNERGKLKIAVSIFGRSTPVELEYWQVEKA